MENLKKVSGLITPPLIAGVLLAVSLPQVASAGTITDDYHQNLQILSGLSGKKASIRNKAASRARKYIGRDYNAAYLHGNKDDRGALHCAQLVWAAYWYGAHIDLNARRGDDIVWPWDLKDSSKAVTYATVR
ncbi:hypothetical protein [Scardovia wiggsiae]